MWRGLQVPRVDREARVLGSFVCRADHVAHVPHASSRFVNCDDIKLSDVEVLNRELNRYRLAGGLRRIVEPADPGVFGPFVNAKWMRNRLHPK